MDSRSRMGMALQVVVRNEDMVGSVNKKYSLFPFEAKMSFVVPMYASATQTETHLF